MKIEEITKAISNAETTIKNLNDMLIKEIYDRVINVFDRNKFKDRYVDNFYKWLKEARENNHRAIVSTVRAAMYTKDEFGFCYLTPVCKPGWYSEDRYQIPYEIIEAINNELNK